MLGLPSCKQVSELSSQQLDEKLPLMRRVGLKIHVMICEQCRRYARQMKLTDQSLRYWMRGKPMPQAVKLHLLKEFEVAHSERHEDSQRASKD